MALKDQVLKYRVQLVYLLIALSVMLPLLKAGFVLTLDMVFTPHVRMPVSVTSSYLFYTVLHYLNFLIPADVLEKVILLGILFLAGYGMHRVVGFVLGRQSAPLGNAELGRHVGGTLYMINPFTYSRFMAGQFAVLLGYCLLPFLLYSLLALAGRPSWRAGLVVAVWITVIGIVSIHTLGLAGVLFVAVLVLAVWRSRHYDGQFAAVLKFSAVSIGLAFVMSSYWLVPLLLGHGTTDQAIAGFNTGDDQTFATLGGSVVGKVANVVRLQGFWAEGHGLFVLPQTHVVGWGLVVLLVWLLVGAGVVSAWRRQARCATAVLLVSAAVGVLLAIGVVNGPLEHAVRLFNGFREPDKFVGLVALAYAFFAAEGVRAVIDRYERSKQPVRRAAVLCVALLLPVVLTPTMFWGFGGQLRTVEYPVSWSAMNTRFNQDSSDFQVLFLPWHLYMYYGFAGRIIASPAPDFFDKSTLASNLPEIGHASPTDLNPQKLELDKMLPLAAGGTHLGSRLAPLHIKYVLLDKDDDYRRYGYLNRQTDLRLVSQDNNFMLYINTVYGEKHEAPNS
ncbi:MAG TPA: hypothetical protein VGM08_03135 [Candidatus Saccharimonadales bacterium]|jgi:hypothetical protein